MRLELDQIQDFDERCYTPSPGGQKWAQRRPDADPTTSRRAASQAAGHLYRLDCAQVQRMSARTG
jgi:hypothetical protein